MQHKQHNEQRLRRGGDSNLSLWRSMRRKSKLHGQSWKRGYDGREELEGQRKLGALFMFLGVS